MKKSLVLGVMAMFAINLICVQNVNAQEEEEINRQASAPAKTSVSARPAASKQGNGKNVDSKLQKDNSNVAPASQGATTTVVNKVENSNSRTATAPVTTKVPKTGTTISTDVNKELSGKETSGRKVMTTTTKGSAEGRKIRGSEKMSIKKGATTTATGTLDKKAQGKDNGKVKSAVGTTTSATGTINSSAAGKEPIVTGTPASAGTTTTATGTLDNSAQGNEKHVLKATKSESTLKMNPKNLQKEVKKDEAEKNNAGIK